MGNSAESDLKSFEALADAFTEKELIPGIAEYDRYPFGKFFDEVVEKAYEAGFLTAMLPAEFGGAAAGIGALCTILKAICRADASLGGIVFTAAHVQAILAQAEEVEILGEIYGRASSARDVMVAYPSYLDPSQAEQLPQADRSGNRYLLSGALDMVVLGNMAARGIIPARSPGKSGFSFFLADLEGTDRSESPPVMTLGLHACPAIDIQLEGTKARLIGEEGKGPLYFERICGEMHTATAAMNAGVMRGGFREALGYARERFQGGRPIANWSEIGMTLADMAMKTEAADLCLEQACRLLERGEAGDGRQCVAVALQIHELACAVVTAGVQVLGGYGYMKDYGQEKRYRDARQIQGLLGSASLRKLELISKYSVT